MDLFTHALIPYAAGRLLRLDRKDRFALLVGGASPDLDTLFILVPMLIPGLYIFSHRGVFHSFAFFWVMVSLGLFIASSGSFRRLAARSLRYDVDLPLSRRSMILGCFGGAAHLLLDYVTTDGPALLYPVSEERYALDLFTYLDPLLTLFAIILITLPARLRIPWQRIRAPLAVFVVLLLGFAVVRVSMRSSAMSLSSEVYPTDIMNEWVVVVREDGLISAYIYDVASARMVYEHLYPDDRANDSLAGILAISDSLPEVKGFMWGSDVVATQVEHDPVNATWSVTYTDVVADVRRAGMGLSSWVFTGATYTVVVSG